YRLRRGSPGNLNSISTSCSGWRTGSARSISVSTRLKIAVFAPMPMASVRTATAVKPRLLTRVRTAKRASTITSIANRKIADRKSPIADSLCPAALDVLHHALRSDLGAVDIPLRVDCDAFGGAGARRRLRGIGVGRIGNEIRDLQILRAPDADAAL